jgi:predicted dehydrogenase
MSETKFHRRHLLRTAGLAAAAKAKGAPGPIRTAILGTQHSHLTSKMKAMLDSPDYQVAVACEPDAAARKRREADPQFKNVRWVSEEELLGDASIQFVLVECKVWEAIGWGRKVIAAGKHLHLEKPPSPDLPPFRELVEEARRKKLCVQMGYGYRFDQAISAAIEAARKGWLGDVLMVRATMNSDRDAAQRAIEARYPGGAMFELGGHMIDRVVDLLGRPRDVRSWIRHDTKVDDTLADNTLAVLEYPKTLATVSITASMAGAGQHRSFEIIGSDGTFFIQPIAGPRTLRVHMRSARGTYRAGWQEMQVPPQPGDVMEFQDLARAIRAGEPLRYSYDHELLVHETLLRASGHPI